MKLLVSVVQPDEAEAAVLGGSHIIDVKNPEEGTFGANTPEVIRAVRQMVPSTVLVSATLGDLPDLPGTAALAALGASMAGADYLKAGLFGARNEGSAVKVLTRIIQTIHGFDRQGRIIAAGYGDYKEIGGISPLELVNAGHQAGVDGILIDVASKQNGDLFDYLSLDYLAMIVEEAHSYNLEVAVAGGLKLDDVSCIREINADIVGVRRSVCVPGVDVLQVDQGRVASFVSAIEKH
ncbi:MAG: (5-formylfuran-3-yl)methyl phosphate synthase [Candidatus Ranarchaeia archaeon]